MGAETTADEACEGGASPRTVWRYGRASRAHVVVDGAAYFALIREAMLNARQRIHLIGWDFDTRIRLGRRGRAGKRAPNEPPERLGPFIVWLARQKPELEILILKWDIGALKSLARGSMLLDLLRWWRQDGIVFKLDSAHPVGCSHHQKVVVIDDVVAVCGGIDLTGDRWDTRDHLDDDPRRRRPTGRPYKPWHDCTMMLEGEAAAHLGEYGRERWRQAGAGELAACRPQQETAWPEQLRAEFNDVDVGIVRTRSQHGEFDEVHEIESLYLELIARAKRFIYAENQYFASRRIAEAICRRLGEPDPPEVVLVTSATANGWLEHEAMDSARVLLVRTLRERDHAGRFSIWTPHTACGQPIYVHAKLMIVDDEVLRVGSANMNNRSMGLDSECDVFIDCARPANSDAGAKIAHLRHSLLAEHCAVALDEVASLIERHGSMAGMIRALPPEGRGLRPLPLQEPTGTEKELAKIEALDPERPEEMLAFYHRRGLFRGRLRWPRRSPSRGQKPSEKEEGL